MTNSERVRAAMIILAENIVGGHLVTDRSGVKLVEILSAFLIMDPLDQHLDVGVWKTNEAYVKKELDWYLSEDRSIKGHVDDVEIWRQVADRDGIVNSNYGWCVFSKENGDQYRRAVAELSTNPSSRRASMIYTRPSMWTDAVENGRNDFVCTWGVQTYLREGRLYYHILQRSCDIFFGLFNDWAWHAYVYQRMLDDLEVEAGKVTYFIDSLHAYERHFPRLLALLDGPGRDKVEKKEGA